MKEKWHNWYKTLNKCISSFKVKLSCNTKIQNIVDFIKETVLQCGVDYL